MKKTFLIATTLITSFAAFAEFEAGVDFDYLSAYVWRNAVQNDRMVMEPCVWADYSFLEAYYLGFTVWQNYDLTDRRRDTYDHALNETDYNIHAGAALWNSDDDESALKLEMGHEWYTYHGVSDGQDTREIYLRINYDNPFVNVYGQSSWMYEDFGDYHSAMHYELGFNREVEIIETLSAGIDWNVNFGDRRYLNFLYDADPSEGFGGTTVKLYLNWQLNENVALGGTIAYTGILSDQIRDEVDDNRDLLWGGLQLKLSY